MWTPKTLRRLAVPREVREALEDCAQALWWVVVLLLLISTLETQLRV